MRQLMRDRQRWIVALVLLLAVVAILAVRRTHSQQLAPGDVQVTGRVMNRIEGSRFCAYRTAHVTFALRGSIHQGSTQVLTCAQAWSEGDRIALVVRARDGQIVRPSRASGTSFAVQVAIATATLLGVAALTFLAWRRRLIKRIIG